ncbi:uncharacterized protein LOC116347055 [Contarinia nasturtii]|uniref:uncharacterized protein LOC116347055 n=1 Tax=Contarinia nasturtii TaxID=265458 RepID=UPI0012D37B6E|nr:uncharacterized protein LOC116347055 [Contarinia nasturtii]
MDCLLTIIVGLFIAINLNVTTAYQDYSLRKLCSGSEFHRSFNKLYHNEPGLALFNQSDSATYVHDTLIKDNIDEFQNCEFTVDGNLYTPNGQYRRGIFASVNRLNFRLYSNGTCIDYVRFRFVNDSTDKICGRFNAEDEIGQRSFFTEPSGVIKVHIFVDKSIPFTPQQDSVQVNLLFTAYEPCMANRNLIKCIPNNDEYCISSVFKNDDVQNCPPPAGDERNKQQKSNQIQYHDGNGRSTKSGVTKNSITFGLLFISAYMALSLSYIL